MFARFVLALRSRLPCTRTWLAWLLPVTAWAALTYPGYFELHSGFLPVFNLADLAGHLTDFAWAPMVGQPYDLFRGERVLPYLLGVVPALAGLPGVAAVKWVFGSSILAGTLGMYGWARRRLGPWPGLLAGLVYAFWPLGLATVYVRGAFAEAVFLGLMPWALWAADAAADTDRPGPAIALGLAVAASLWTQAGLALWLAALLAISVFALRSPGRAGHQAAGGSRLRRALLPWLGLAAGVVLGAAGLWPVVLKHGVGGVSWVDFADHFVYPHQLLAAGWGAGPSIAGPYDTLTFQLGLVACGLAVLGLASGLRHEGPGEMGRNSAKPLRGTHHVAIVLALTFLSTTLAAPVWRALPFLGRSLTYPWQLLLLAGPWLAWLAGWGGRRLLELLPASERKTAAVPLFAILITLALLGSYSYLQPTPSNGLPPARPAAIFGDDEIALLDWSFAGQPGPGRLLTLQVRWQALRPLERDYTVFLHAVGPDGTLWGQEDTMPQGNQLPTSQWRPGQVVDDAYTLTLKPDAPAGAGYRYLLGFYLWQTGERLPAGSDDKVLIEP